MCLRCQSNIFPLFDQSNWDVSLINCGFNNFRISSDTNIFPDENLKLFFTKYNSIEITCNDSDHPVPVDSRYHDIKDFNKLNINKNSSLAPLHLNIASLSKHFEDLQNFVSLLKHSFDIIGISEHKITKGSKNSAFNLLGYTFCFNETETSHGGTDFFVSNNLTYKPQPDLLINEHRKLESTVIELIFPNKKNICGTIYKHLGMKISDFNNYYLTPLPAKILQEERHAC